MRPPRARKQQEEMALRVGVCSTCPMGLMAKDPARKGREAMQQSPAPGAIRTEQWGGTQGACGAVLSFLVWLVVTQVFSLHDLRAYHSSIMSRNMYLCLMYFSVHGCVWRGRQSGVAGGTAGVCWEGPRLVGLSCGKVG